MTSVPDMARVTTLPVQISSLLPTSTSAMTSPSVPDEESTVLEPSTLTVVIIMIVTLSGVMVMVLLTAFTVTRKTKKVSDSQVNRLTNENPQVKKNDNNPDMKYDAMTTKVKEEGTYRLYESLSGYNETHPDKDDGYAEIGECESEGDPSSPHTQCHVTVKAVNEKVESVTLKLTNIPVEPHTKEDGNVITDHSEQKPHLELWHSNATSTTFDIYSHSPEYDMCVQQQNHGAGYDTVAGYEKIAGYEKPETYETATTYQTATIYQTATTYQSTTGYERVTTYEMAVTYEKVPMSTFTLSPPE